MFFELQKYSSNTAVESEQGLKMTYAELDNASHSVVKDLEPRKLCFCLCENTIGSFVGYVGLMNANMPTVLLDGSKDIEIIQGLVEHYNPKYIWTPTHRKDIINNGIYKRQ